MTKELTQENLRGFEDWLIRRGRSDETARCYLHQLKKSIESRDVMERLRDKKLAPKTRRVNMAALKQWAKYAKDGELVSELDEIRLPPAIRVSPKTELEIHEWRAIIEGLEAEKLPQGIRNVLMIVALRGLRIGDVLRLTRDDVRHAIATGILSYEAKGSRRLEYDAGVMMAQLRELAATPDWKLVRDLVGRPTSPDRSINKRIRRALRRVAKAQGVVGVHPHRLRRTYATHFVRRLGNDPQALIKLTKHMGWTNINTAAQYVDNVNAVELDQMGKDLLADVMRPKKPKK